VNKKKKKNRKGAEEGLIVRLGKSFAQPDEKMVGDRVRKGKKSPLDASVEKKFETLTQKFLLSP